MITILLSFLSGPLGRIVGAGAAFLVAGGVIWALVAQHDAAVRAELLANQQAQYAKQAADLHARTVAAFGKLLAEQQAATDSRAAVEKEISNAPVTTGCVGSPAIGAALRGLRDDVPSPSPAPVNPSGNAGVRRTTGGIKSHK
jgi:uncharacterized iron-regulated protein